MSRNLVVEHVKPEARADVEPAELIARRLEDLAADVRAFGASSKTSLAVPARCEAGHEQGAATPAPTPMSPTKSPSLLIAQRELADLIGASERTVQRMRHEGLLPAPLKFGGRPRWRRADIERWVKEQPSS